VALMGGGAEAARPMKRRDERLNAWLTVLLLAGIVVAGNMLAGPRLRLRRDLSEDQLFTVGAATERILQNLEDRLQVRTYFTRDTELGDVQLGRARLEAQLADFRTLARGRMEVVDLDPVTSTSARTEARNAGVRPIPQSRTRGTETIDEDVWLGLTLRYRGREQVIPYAQPWRFEVQFASAVHSLVRDRRVVVGFFNAPHARPPREAPKTKAAALENEIAAAWPMFGNVANMLARTREVREVTGLAEGLPVANDIDVLVVVASEWLHRRAVFELDRFVQRGGALIVAVDDPVFNWRTGIARTATPRSPLETELGHMLRTIGARVLPQHVWDLDSTWQTKHYAYRSSLDVVQVTSPAVVSVQADGLSQVLPPTRDLQRVTFWWAHPIVDAARFPAPPGVRREDLAWTSPRGRLAGVLGALPNEPSAMAVIDGSVRPDAGGSYILAAAFTGELPSAFPGGDVPPARDPWSDAPNATVVIPSEPLPADATPGTVVVVGDADWLRDPAVVGREGILMEFSQAGGLLLLENLVDWLTLDEDLIALRSRVPRDRPLVDFVADAMAAEGLADADPMVTEFERRAREAAEDKALARARARRWWTILAPIAAALTLIAVPGIAWNLFERRRTGGAA
jgi:ABC-type uncharacterized transport system involved in gliding motility auxiliary subunit